MLTQKGNNCDNLNEKPLIMDWRSSHNKWWIRAMAVTLTIAFIHQDVVWAQEGAPVWSKSSVDIAIPKDSAVTKQAYQGSAADKKTIINIQDAHSSLGAQESISSILDSLVTNYDLKLVAIEGSSGYIDTSILRTFPDEKIRRSTASSLMAKGRMSAGEFYSITSNKNIALYGIENKDLYKENVEEFKKVYEINQAISGDITKLQGVLSALRYKIYSKELNTLESRSVLKDNSSASFTDRWNYIDSLARKMNISYENYPNLKKLAESIKLEKGVSFNKANAERDTLIGAITKAATKPDLEKLVSNSLSFKQGKIGQGEYYLFLQDLARRYKIDQTSYSDLIKFTDYITIYEAIDLLEIFEEAKLLEDIIKEKLYTSPEQKKLHNIVKCVNYIKDMFELRLTNSDFEYLDNNIKTYNAEAIASFIKEESIKYNIPMEAGYDLGSVFSNIPVAVSFYKTAKKRDHAILNNTIKQMNEQGQTVAALIAGGYHTKGILELLKARRTSYVVILPKFDASKGERPYVAILTNKSDDYKDQLESGKYEFLTDEYLKGSLQDPAAINSFIKDIIVTSLRQAKDDHKNVHEVANLWIDNYRIAFEDLKRKGIIKHVINYNLQGGFDNQDAIDKSNALGDKALATTVNNLQDGCALSPDSMKNAVLAEANKIEPLDEGISQEAETVADRWTRQERRNFILVQLGGENARLTVKDIAALVKKAGQNFSESTIRTDLHDLKKYDQVLKVGKVGRAIAYTASPKAREISIAMLRSKIGWSDSAKRVNKILAENPHIRNELEDIANTTKARIEKALVYSITGYIETPERTITDINAKLSRARRLCREGEISTGSLGNIIKIAEDAKSWKREQIARAREQRRLAAEETAAAPEEPVTEPVLSEHETPAAPEVAPQPETPATMEVSMTSEDGIALDQDEADPLRAANAIDSKYTVFRPGQVSLLRSLVQGGAEELRAGGGKTLPIAGAALKRHRATGEKVIVMTHEDALTRQTMEADKIGGILALCGEITGFILVDSKTKEEEFVIVEKGINGKIVSRNVNADELYNQATIIYGKWDRFVHRKLREKIGACPIALTASRHFVLLDEADLMLVFGHATPCIIAGDALPDAEVRLSIRRDLDKFIDELLSDKSGYLAEKGQEEQAVFTRSGLAKVNEFLKHMAQEHPGMADLINKEGELFAVDAMRARLYYNTPGKTLYINNEGGITVRDEQTGEEKVGMTFGEGLQQAIEVAMGVPKVSLETSINASETITQFLKNSTLITGFGATSGTMDKASFESIYGKTVGRQKGIEVKLVKGGRHIFAAKAEKRAALIDMVRAHIGNGRPGLIKLEDDNELREIEEMIRRECADELMRTGTIIQSVNGQDREGFRNGINRAGYANVITLATNVVHRGININIRGRTLDADGSEGEELLVSDGVIPGLHVISAYFDEAEAFEIQTQARADRGTHQGVWEHIFSLDEDTFVRHAQNLTQELPALSRAASQNDQKEIERLVVKIRQTILDEKNRTDKERRELEDEIAGYQDQIFRLISAVTGTQEVFEDYVRAVVGPSVVVPDAEMGSLRAATRNYLTGLLADFQTTQSNIRRHLDYESQKLSKGVVLGRPETELIKLAEVAAAFKEKTGTAKDECSRIIAGSLGREVIAVTPTARGRDWLGLLKVVGAIVLTIGIGVATVYFGIGIFSEKAFLLISDTIQANHMPFGTIVSALLIGTVYIRQMTAKKIQTLDTSNRLFNRFAFGVGKGNFFAAFAKWVSLMLLQFAAGPGLFVAGGSIIAAIGTPAILAAGIVIPLMPAALGSVTIALVANLVLTGIFAKRFKEVSDVRPTRFMVGINSLIRSMVFTIGTLFAFQFGSGVIVVTATSLAAVFAVTAISSLAARRIERNEAKLPSYIGILGGVIVAVGLVGLSIASGYLPFSVKDVMAVLLAGFGVATLTMHALISYSTARATSHPVRIMLLSLLPNSRTLIMYGSMIPVIFTGGMSPVLAPILIGLTVIGTFILHRYNVDVEKKLGKPVTQGMSEMLGQTISVSAGLTPIIAYPLAAEVAPLMALTQAAEQDSLERALSMMEAYSRQEKNGFKQLRANVSAFFDEAMRGASQIAGRETPQVAGTATETPQAPVAGENEAQGDGPITPPSIPTLPADNSATPPAIPPVQDAQPVLPGAQPAAPTTQGTVTTPEAAAVQQQVPVLDIVQVRYEQELARARNRVYVLKLQMIHEHRKVTRLQGEKEWQIENVARQQSLHEKGAASREDLIAAQTALAAVTERIEAGNRGLKSLSEELKLLLLEEIPAIQRKLESLAERRTRYERDVKGLTGQVAERARERLEEDVIQMARQDRRLADLNLDPAQARDIALLERQLHDRRLLLAQTENYIAIYQREIERIQLDIETLKLQKQHRVTRADMIGRLYKVGAATPLEYRGEIALTSGIEDMMVDAEQDIQVAEENIRYIRERAVLLEREMASLTNQIASQKAREAEADKELVMRIKAILEQAAKPPAERAKDFSEELARVYQLALQYAPAFQARIAIIDSEIARYQRDIVNARGREDVLKLRIRQQENNIRLLTEEQAYLGREYERARKLIASNAISRDEYLSYQASCAIIAKRIESARKELARMNEELRATTEKEIPELESMTSALGEKRKAYQNDADKLNGSLTQLRTALGQVTPMQELGPAYLSAILATSSLRARDLASLQARLFDCQLRLAQAPNRIAALERSIERANFESEALRIDSARKGSRLEMLRKLLANRAASASEYSAALAEFNKAQILVSSTLVNVDILRREIETVKAESDLLEREIASLTSQIDSQKAREADAAKALETRIRSILEQAAKPPAERPQGFSEEAALVYQLILQYAPAFQARIAIIDSEIARYQRDLLNARGREEVLKLRIRQQEYNISMLTEQQNLRMQAYERAKKLMVSRAVSREEYEMDQAAYEIMRQRVAAAKKELARLNEDLTAITKKEIPRLEDMVRSLKERRERGATEYTPDKLNEYLAKLRAALGQVPAAPRPDTAYLSMLLATSALRTRDLTALEDRLFSSRLALAQAPGRIAALERSIERVNFEVRALQSELEQKRQILQMYTKLRASNAVSTEEYEIKLADVRSTEALLQSLRMNAEILRSQIGTIRSESALIENEIESLTRQIDAEKERVTTERARNVEEEERARQRTDCIDIDAALANLSWVDNYMPGTTQAERSVREGFKQSVAEVLFLADPDAVSSLSPIFMTPDGRLETAEQKKNVAKLFSILKNLNVLSGVLSKNPYYSGRGVTDGIKISIATDLIKKGEASDWATIFNLDGTLRGATAEERNALLRRLESIFHDAALLHSSLVSNRIENVRAWGIAMALATNPDRLTSWRANGMFLQGGFELSPRALKVFAKADVLRPAFMADDLLTEMEAEGIAMSLAMEQGDDKGLSYWQKNSLVVEERGTYRLTEKGKCLIRIYKTLNASPIKASIDGNQDHKSGVLMAIAMDLVINGEDSGWAIYLDPATGNIKGRNENETTSNREAVIKIFRIAKKIKDQGIVALQGDTPESQGNMIAIAMDLVRSVDNSAWAPYFNMDGTVRGTTGAEKAANRDDVQEIFNIVNGKPNKYTNEILTNEQVAILTGKRVEDITIGDRTSQALSLLPFLKSQFPLASITQEAVQPQAAVTMPTAEEMRIGQPNEALRRERYSVLVKLYNEARELYSVQGQTQEVKIKSLEKMMAIAAAMQQLIDSEDIRNVIAQLNKIMSTIRPQGQPQTRTTLTYDEFEALPSDDAFNDETWVVHTKPTGYFAYDNPMRVLVWDDASNSYIEKRYQDYQDTGRLTIALRQGDSWPTILALNGAGYVRFSANPPLRMGATLRLGAYQAGLQGQQFPRITEVRLRKINNSQYRVILTLDSDLYSGTVNILLTPGDSTAMNISATYKMKRDLDISREKNTGFIAFASMFGIHPRTSSIVHDSDTLEVVYADGARVTRRLANPADRVCEDLTRPGTTIASFGLEQRNRIADSFRDRGPEYHQRSSYVISIRSSNIPLGIVLNEDHSETDNSDNVYPIVTPQANLRAGQEITLQYDAVANRGGLAQVGGTEARCTASDAASPGRRTARRHIDRRAYQKGQESRALHRDLLPCYRPNVGVGEKQEKWVIGRHCQEHKDMVCLCQ